MKLHTVICYPRNYEEGQKLTVVMDRSPYGSTGLELINDIMLPFGFITVGQDMRGTGGSEGEFSIWHSDANDSQDTGNWLVEQSWSNGQVYTFGASADGLAAYTTVTNQPAWLKAQYFVWSSSQGYEVIYPNGAYLTSLADMWIRSTVPEHADEDLAIIAENEAHTDWWLPLDLTGQYWRVNFPAAFWAGWYDIFLVGNLAAYEGYNFESDASSRYTTRLVVDPLGHCQDAAKYFSEDVIAGRTILPAAQWLELFGVRPVTRTNIRNVTFYVMSSNDDAGRAAGQFWTTLDAFPRPTMTKYFLHPDRSLSTSPPSESEAGSKSTSYTYDPSNPVPSMGGNNLQLPCGPLDQSTIDQRADVLVFNTPPQTSELVMTGPLFATLFVSSDAVDTDFNVRLSDVYPTGEARLIQDNAVRMRWRERGLEPVWMKAGEVYEVTLTLWNTSYIVAPGHSLRVAITSSNSPRFDVNRNNGILLKDRQASDVNITAVNTVHHSSTYASYVSLPIVKKAQLPQVHNLKEQVQKAYPQVDWDKIEKEYPERIRKMAFPF